MSVKLGDICGAAGLITQSTQLQEHVIFSEPVLMSQARRVREIVCASIGIEIRAVEVARILLPTPRQ
jgi:hypothetical protein